MPISPPTNLDSKRMRKFMKVKVVKMQSQTCLWEQRILYTSHEETEENSFSNLPSDPSGLV